MGTGKGNKISKQSRLLNVTFVLFFSIMDIHKHRVAGMRKIRRIFGRTSHSSSKNSDEGTTDEALDEHSSIIMSASGAAHPVPGSSSSQPNPSASIGNSSTSSGRHHLAAQASLVSNQQQHPTATSPTPEPAPAFLTQSDLEPLLAELGSRRNEVTRLQEEFESAKTQMQSECSLLHQSLQEERYRFEVSIRLVLIHSCYIRLPSNNKLLLPSLIHHDCSCN